jgi:hypothetical protein
MVMPLALAALVAVALWQKVDERLPYLLDPASAPTPRLSLAAGLFAVVAFVAVQAGLNFFLSSTMELAPSLQASIAFVAAGGVVTLGALALLRQVPDLPRLLGLVAGADERPGGVRRALVSGLVAGVTAGLFGIGYLIVTRWVGLVDAGPWALGLSLVDIVALLVVTLVAAPLFEEFIFRGLVLRGMLRSVPPAIAVVGCALVFALIHPPASFIPVFVAGVAAALSVRRSGLLLAPIVTHVVYNAMVTAYGLL